MRVKASEISEIRKKNAKIIVEKLEQGIQDLEMKKSRFKIQVESGDNAVFKANGTDSVEILFSSNLGEDLKPLAKVASGGEISRIMLVLKDVLADSDEVPTMIFDEIDVGISGKSAFAVAKKMKTIADKKQILSVTHLAPIAGAGNNNLFIEKVLENERTFTKVRTLNKEEVIMEVARIVSGDNITGSAIEHAKEIIM
jgi:DNA repair protein RecN (Recombination protein N)